MSAANRTLPIDIERKAIASLCQQYHIYKLSLFGSVLREDFRPDSDVDILVEFEPGKTPGFEFIDVQDRLSEIIGRQVDLNTPKCLSRYFREQVAAEAWVVYVKE
ncbi:MAG: nucleotidyltransferase family protein [Phormidesmis sp.]